MTGRVAKRLIWLGLAAAIIFPVLLAANSPFLQWRGPVYIIAGFAGIFGLCVLLIQPLLAGQMLPNVSPIKSRRLHQWAGAFLILSVLVHVIGLWFTSPPDVIDVLLFRSPTPFSVWGVVAMWAVFATGALAIFRNRLRMRPRNWKRLHLVLGAIIVSGTVVHALLIEGAMETISKTLLCALVVLAFASAAVRTRGLR